MREESIGSFIALGSRLRYLLDAGEAGGGHPIHGPGRLTANIRQFLTELEALGLTITSNVAKNESLPKILEELAHTEPGSTLTKDQAKRLANSVRSIKTTLRAEAEEKKAFVTSPKRWDVDRLLKDPGSMFGEKVYERLDTYAAYDFEEACKCIAFERPTAAAFHTMRGTEATLRAFYCHIVKQKRLSRDKQMWGPILDQLKKRSKPPPKPLLDNLDAIRFNFRNPTQHPDEIHTIDSAQDLFGLTIPAVNEMTAIIAGER